MIIWPVQTCSSAVSEVMAAIDCSIEIYNCGDGLKVVQALADGWVIEYKDDKQAYCKL